MRSPVLIDFTKQPVGEAVAWQEDLVLDGRRVVDDLSSALPSPAADLLEIAAAIHAADRLVRRASGRDPYGLQWSRDIAVRIPVREPARWRDRLVYESLIALLDWLTNDRWCIHFAPMDARGPLDDDRLFLFPTISPTSHVALFSGGLDSAAGLLIDAVNSADDVVAVSLATNSRMIATQREVLAGIGRYCGIMPQHARFRVTLRRHDRETTKRSRGMLFLAAGVATAWTVGSTALTVYENGIGAINLPVLRSQIGSQATRAMHPKTLNLAAKTVSAVAGSEFTIRNPYRYETKASLVRKVGADADWILGITKSCDSAYSSRRPAGAACGHCTSCLLRRQSLLAAGRPAVDSMTSYAAQPVNESPELRNTLWQVGRLERAVRSMQPWQTLVMEFPELLAVPGIHEPVIQRWLMRMYESYVDEWRRVTPLPSAGDSQSPSMVGR